MRKDEIYNLIWEEPYILGHWVGFNDLTQLHNEWLRKMLFNTDDWTLQSHRGSYKTTVVALFLAINAIIRPSLRAIFLRKTDDDVKDVIRQVSNVLKSGHFRVIVRTLYGVDLQLITDSAFEISTNLMHDAFGSPQIRGLGIKTSITGKHGDIILTDDIANISDRVSKAERDTTCRMYEELQNVKNRGGRFINTGTPWHIDDVFRLMTNIERYDCYTTGLMNPDEIRWQRDKMSSAMFAANYELKHITDVNALFIDPQFITGPELLYNGVCHLDAAYGGSDRTAFTAMHTLPDGRTVALGKVWEGHVDGHLNEILRLHKHYRLGTLFLETNADKGYLRRDLERQGIPTSPYFEKMNKFIKISTYLKGSWSGLFWLDETDPEYLAEILDYSENAAHDDCPDSAASLIRATQKKVKLHTLKGGL